jgi:hypothetical protein
MRRELSLLLVVLLLAGCCDLQPPPGETAQTRIREALHGGG